MEMIKKAWPELFQKVVDGEKNFDLRLDDFDCSVGDVLILKEFDPETKEFTGREIKKEVKYVLKSSDLKFFSKEDLNKGFQVLGF